MLRVPLELNRQLQDWLGHLPSSIRPDTGGSDRREMYKVILKLRYHATGEIIFRPFLFQALSLPPEATIGSDTLHNCKTCILHCRSYVKVVHERVSTPSAQTEIVLHRYAFTLDSPTSRETYELCTEAEHSDAFSTLAATLIMTLCSLSSHTKHLVPDVDDIQEQAIGLVRQWAWPRSSVESMLSLLLTMRDKCRTVYAFESP